MWSKLLVLCGLLSSSGASILSSTELSSCESTKLAYREKCDCSAVEEPTCFTDWNPSGVNHMRLDLSSLVTTTYEYDGETYPYLYHEYIDDFNNPETTFYGLTEYFMVNYDGTQYEGETFFVKMQTLNNFMLTIDGSKDTEIMHWCDSTKTMCDPNTYTDQLLYSTLYLDTLEGSIVQQFVTYIYDDYENDVLEPKAPIVLPLDAFSNYDDSMTYIEWFESQTNLFQCRANATGHCLDQSIIEGPPPLLVEPVRRRLKQLSPVDMHERTKQLEAKRDLAREHVKRHIRQPKRKARKLLQLGGKGGSS